MNIIEEKCDRRTSRAARKILMNKTVPILHYFHDGTDNFVEASFAALPETEQISLYGNLISDLIDPRSKHCVLKPEMDIFWEEEVGHITLKSRSRRYPPGSRKDKIHKCPICHKQFFSRYYLDLHMDSQHHIATNTEMKICPANVICNALTQAECNHMALEHEPHYAPGLYGSGSSNSNHIRLEFQKMIDHTPCSEHDLKKSHAECSNIVSECFRHNKDLARDFENALCQIHTCRRKLHGLAGFSNLNLHKVQEQFDYHHDVNNIWTIIFAVSALCLFYSKPIRNLAKSKLNPKEKGMKMVLNKRKKLD
jgi:hypothetical protein